MEVNGAKYPHTAAYLKTLPLGVESFSGCLIRADVLQNILVDFPSLRADGELPPMLLDFIKGKSTQWVPEAVGNIFYMLVRDLSDSDESFLAWNRKNIMRVFNQPLNRALIFIFSASLIVMGSAKRWSTFHRGTELKPEPIAQQNRRFIAKVNLTAPARLFTNLMLRQHCTTFESALDACKARDIRVELDKVGDEKTIYIASWDATFS
jgi:hypothetical protein